MKNEFITKIEYLIAELTVPIPVIEYDDQSDYLITKNPIIWRDLRINFLLIKNCLSFEKIINETKNSYAESLIFILLPEIFPSLSYLLLENYLVFFPIDIQSIEQNKCNLPDLIDYKFHRLFYMSRTFEDTLFDQKLFDEFIFNSKIQNKYSSNLSSVLKNRQLNPSDWVDHPLCDKIKSSFEKDDLQVLVGASSSGKTTLAFQIGWKENLNEKLVNYMNMNQFQNVNLKFSLFLLELQKGNNSLLIIDDIQSNPNSSIFIFRIIELTRKCSIIPLCRLLLLTWPNFVETLSNELSDSKVLHITSEQIRNGLIKKTFPDLIDKRVQEIIDSYGSDLFLLNACLKYFEKNNFIPSNSDLAEYFLSLWHDQSDALKENDAKRILIVVCALGRFDLYISKPFLFEVSGCHEETLDLLIEKQILRYIQGLLTIGHRSFAILLGDFLESENIWLEVEKKNGPRNISDTILLFLRSLPPPKTLETLRLLQNQSGFKGNINLSQRTGALIEVWKAFESVLERISSQQEIDPSWGKIPSSVMFATQSLCAIGKNKEAEKSMNFLRTIWHTDHKNDIFIDLSKLPTKEDFEKIHDRMVEEDHNYLINNSVLKWESSQSLNMSLMHKNWLLGVLLTAEATYDDKSDYKKKLLEYIFRTQLNSGAFYPERVPWVTARILIGLAAAGVTSAYSPNVRKAIDWLLKPQSEGGAITDGIWHSGTGSWNTDLEVTSMCVLALINSGVDPNDLRLNRAKTFIYSSKTQWVNPTNILDGALAAEAFITLGGSWDDIANEVKEISQWTRAESFWKSANKGSNETFTQSCRVSQISSHLVNIGWSAIKIDLPALVNAFTIPRIIITKKESKDEVRPIISAKSVDRSLTNALNQFEMIKKIGLSDLTVVGDYKRFDEKVRNRLIDWKKSIVNPLINKSSAHENFLIWAAPGSGKTFFIQEIAKEIKNDIDYIEINLALMSKEKVIESLHEAKNNSRSVLCLIDEVDARSDETWPYEEIFSFLDLNTKDDKKIVYVLIGSSSSGIEGLTLNISKRLKGKDLVDRIPNDRRFTIPKLEEMDKVILFVHQILLASQKRGGNLTQFEKLALYYIILNESLSSPRQLRDFAISAVQRVAIDEDKLRYVDLFAKGNPESHRFWSKEQPLSERLSETFILFE